MSLEFLPKPVAIVSHSQMETWDRCTFKWHISYELGYAPLERFRGMELGSMLHELLALWYDNTDKALAESLIDQKINAWCEEFMNDSFGIQSVATATWLIKKYIHEYALESDRLWEVVDVEKHFSILLTTPKGRLYILQGYIDLVLRIEGEVWVVDHKSGQKFWTPNEVLMDSQMPLYAAALRHEGANVFGIIINMLGTYPYKDKLKVKLEQIFRREPTYRTPHELDSILLNAGYVVDEMIDKDQPIRRSLKKDCSKCWAQDPCLLSLKGVPLELVLESTARKKESYRKDEEEVEAVPAQPTEIEVIFY